ncbi:MULTISPECIES: metallophosphoesterase [unclassified Rhodococcus (in: high G+C Gram-positive bacteria)]|uniref:metallophosphoesterase family protein n=1 Tax=unclassified Rhodococcus (in: high G+C Gram-positive bacteria) TaxID=192944 RepID=UPI0005D2FF8C|nr:MULTISPECIES: metallophosphoesterase [unclassified Rhodococcus (in: high G+C Gram-positive bacteria)]KJF20136.1 Calcineurin-like phosphoesterase superfamily domain protein [Rhodococcus sp. AD45]
MNELTIVHISDIHFNADGGNLSPERALELASKAIRQEDPDWGNSILVLSGDFTTRGNKNGFNTASHYIHEYLLSDKMNFSSVLVCPGNHDITDTGCSFHEFNKFAFGITDDSAQTFTATRTICSVSRLGYRFVLVNSAHHGDHTYGKVDLEQLRDALEASTPDEPIILVVHHSPISSRYGGHGLEHSYELLTLASHYKVALLLHGDIHSNQILTVGSAGTKVLGVGSLGFPPDPNMNNQFAVYKIEENTFSGKLFNFQANRDMFIPSDLEPK